MEWPEELDLVAIGGQNGADIGEAEADLTNLFKNGDDGGLPSFVQPADLTDDDFNWITPTGAEDSSDDEGDRQFAALPRTRVCRRSCSAG